MWGSRRPLSIFIPALAIWAVIDIPAYPWFRGESVLYTMLYWSSLGLLNGTSNSVFPFTLLSAIISFLLSFAWLHEAGLDRIRALLLGASFPFAFTSAFEFVWQNAFIVVRPSLFRGTLAGDILMASWLFLGFSTVHYWEVTRRFILGLAFLVVSFEAWFAVGYPQIFIASEYWLAFPFNVTTKVLLASVFLVLLYDGTRELAKGNGPRRVNSNS